MSSGNAVLVLGACGPSTAARGHTMDRTKKSSTSRTSMRVKSSSVALRRSHLYLTGGMRRRRRRERRTRDAEGVKVRAKLVFGDMSIDLEGMTAAERYRQLTQPDKAAPKASAETPAFEMPKFELPKFNMPKGPEVPKPEPEEVPQVEAPPPAPPVIESNPTVQVPATSAEVVPAPEAPSPSFEAPEMPEMPKFEAPEMPEMPKFNMPKFNMPKVEVPKFEMPEMPEMPKVEVPKIEMPEMPKVPEVPKPEEVPQVEAPASVVPDVVAPSAEVVPTPEAPSPSFEAPEMPEMPKFEAPEMPEMPKFEAPEMPEMPKFNMPKFNMPKVEVPKLEMPEMPEVPEMPKVPEVPKPEEVPQVEAPAAVVPEVPQVEAPASVVPDVVAPSAEVVPAPEASSLARDKYLELTQPPKAEAPNIEMPKFEAPNIEMPKFEAPSFEVPKFEAPSFEVPKFEAPELPELPKFEVPDLGSSLSNIKGQILDYLQSLPLPKEVNEVVDTAVSQDPQVYKYIAQYGLPLLLFLVWKNAYGGFSGYASPGEVSEFLGVKESDAILIDLRNDLDREDDGIPELKFGARGKVAAIPFQNVVSGATNLVKSGATKLQIELTAIVIANLAAIDRRKTRVFLMARSKGETDGAAKSLARLLRKAGLRNVFLMEGGFSQWQNDELPCVQGGSGSYEKERGTIKVLGDRVEEIFTGDSPAENFNPFSQAGLIAFVAFLVVANYEYVLEAVGVLGVLATALVYTTGFDTVEDLIEDLQSKSKAASDFTTEVKDKIEEIKN